MFSWKETPIFAGKIYSLEKACGKSKYSINIRCYPDGSKNFSCNEINITYRDLKSESIEDAKNEALYIISKKMQTKIDDFSELVNKTYDVFEWVDVNSVFGTHNSYMLKRKDENDKYSIVLRHYEKENNTFIINMPSINIKKVLKSKNLKDAQNEAILVISKKINTKIKDYQEIIDFYKDNN